jgi:hypothetical protein
MNEVETLRQQMDRAQVSALAVGVAASAAFLAGALFAPDPARFMRSYLLAFLFWTGLALGCSMLIMLQHLVNGQWGLIIRRLLESGTRTLPLMAVFALPLVVGAPRLYIWARPELVRADPVLKHKALYLNMPFFAGRAILYFAIWLILAFFLNRWSAEQDRTGSPDVLRRLRALSAPGLVLCVFTATFASFDWAMSLEPHWFSTAYGALFVVGQVLSALAFTIALTMVLADRKPLSGVITKKRLNDLGNMLLAFVLLWAYISFSQFLIIWAGNLPEEITWYAHRLTGGWAILAVILLLFHFALPFLILLSRAVKRKARTLGAVAAALFVVRLLDLFWTVIPVDGQGAPRGSWMDAAAPIGMGGIWLALFVWQLKSRPLLPVNDPLLHREAIHE